MKKVLTSGGKAVLVGGKAMVGSVTNEPVQESDINFYDYDGTLLHAWSLAELQGKTELPELPTQPGLICQGWNWTLAELKATNRIMDVAPMYITDDGATRLHITLLEGRLSPKVGLAVNGSATIDWGDGSAAATLTGTDTATVVYTAAHTYPSAGDYVISITVTGAAVVLGTDDASTLLTNTAEYISALTEFNQGANVALGAKAFKNCRQMSKLTMPTAGGSSSEQTMNCYSLRLYMLPRNVTRLEDGFQNMASLQVLSLPNSIKTIAGYSIANTNALQRVALPDGATTLDGGAISTCYGVREISLGTNFIMLSAWSMREVKTMRVIKFPGNPNLRIGGSILRDNDSLEIVDFTACTVVPPMLGAGAFTGSNDSFEIRVPAALVDEWKAATNWATYADHIVGV